MRAFDSTLQFHRPACDQQHGGSGVLPVFQIQVKGEELLVLEA
jgi:hypothetical protein